MKWISFLMLVAADCIYKVLSDKIPGEVNPFASMVATYGAALVTSVILFLITSKGSSLPGEFRKLNLYSALIGLVVCFYELGYIFAYRSGFKVALLSPLMSVAVMVVMALIGVLLFKEKITMMNTIGLIIASIGVLMTIN
ncbi:MAG: EamA family transporter [Erysipelotrichaceae bacterium]|nr:EamA family transporter [Erysipelotrichaceae bacterium]